VDFGINVAKLCAPNRFCLRINQLKKQLEKLRYVVIVAVVVAAAAAAAIIIIIIIIGATAWFQP